MAKSIPSWLPTFQQHLTTPAQTFSIASITQDGFPTVRTCVFRGFLFNLPMDSRNALRSLNPEPNPSKLTCSLLTFTTDARMAKYAELKRNPDCGACFWIEDSEDKPQWRFRGKAHFFSYKGTDGSTEQDRSTLSEDIVGSELGNTSKETFDVGGEQMSWRNEVLRHFANLGPGMRGTFANPAPGTQYDDDKSSELGRRITDAVLKKEFLGENSDEANENWDEKRKVLFEALENFRVVIIRVDRIDRVDLAAKGGKGRRWIYERAGRDWHEREVWP